MELSTEVYLGAHHDREVEVLFHVHTVGELEGHPGHLPGELPLQLPHRKTLAKYAHGGALTFDPFGPHLRNASALRTIDKLRGIPESQWQDVGQHVSYQYQLFPNTAMTFDARHIELWQILPIAPDKSELWSTARTSGWPPGPNPASGPGWSSPWCSAATSPRRSTCTAGSPPPSPPPAPTTDCRECGSEQRSVRDNDLDFPERTVAGPSG
jgi:hypothetical protein